MRDEKEIREKLKELNGRIKYMQFSDEMYLTLRGMIDMLEWVLKISKEENW